MILNIILSFCFIYLAIEAIIPIFKGLFTALPGILLLVILLMLVWDKDEKTLP